MTKCNIDKSQLILYLYGELADQEKTGIEKHLQECPECRAEVDDYRKILDKLSRMPEKKPSNAAPFRLSYPKSRIMRFATYSAIAASFLLLAVITYIKLSTPATPQRSSLARSLRCPDYFGAMQTQPSKTTVQAISTAEDSEMYAWKDNIGDEIDNLKTSADSIISELKTASLATLDDTIKNLDGNIDSIFSETD